MNKKLIIGSYKEMPPWAKGVIGIAVVVGLGFVGYKIYKAVEAAKDDKGARQEDISINQELDKLISQGKPPKRTKAQLLAIANGLETAMQGMGTDTDLIYRAFSYIPTYSDLLGVMSAYGTRTIKSGLSSINSWVGALLIPPVFGDTTFTGSLSMCIGNECSESEIKKINDILAKNGISYKF